MESCENTLDWLANHPLAEDANLSAAASAHITSCEECSQTLRRYRSFTLQSRALYQFIPDESAEKSWLAAARMEQNCSDEPLKESLRYTPEPKAEVAFLAAARQQQSQKARKGRPHWWAAVAIAAAILLAIGGWSASSLIGDGPIRPIPSAAPNIQIANQSGQVDVLHAQMGTPLQSVQQAAVVRTGPASHVQFKQDDNATVTVSAQSEIEVMAWNEDATELALHSGTVLAAVTHREPGETFEILTANARVVVVGTEFSVTYSPLGETIVRGTSGRVRVEGLKGDLIGFVQAGQTLRVSSEPGLEASSPAQKDSEVVAVIEATPKLEHRQSVQSPASPQAENQDKASEEERSLRGARALLAEGREQAVISLLLSLPAKDWQRDALLGDAYQLSGDYSKAQQAYIDALRLANPPPTSLLVNLATLQETHLNSPSEAAQTWQRYLAKSPRGSFAARAHLSVGKSAMKMGQDEAAEAHFRVITTQFPGANQHTAAMTLLAGQFLEQERWDDADTFFQNYLRGRDAKSETAMVGLIRIRIAQGKAKSARQLVREYWSRFPNAQRSHEVRRLMDALKMPVE